MSSGANEGKSPAKESPTRRGSPRGRGSPSARPVMGVPGRSAFTSYIRPPPPPPPPAHWVFPRPSGSGSGSAGGGGGFRFQGAQALHVGGSSSGGVAAPGLQIGGNRKRIRDPAPVEGAPNPQPVRCSVCGREFLTPKALFGHMRSHPGRGWKGAHPPPAFRAEEEFADLRVRGAAPVAVAPAEEAAEDEEGQNYKLPDLNNPPPPDADN